MLDQQMLPVMRRVALPDLYIRLPAGQYSRLVGPTVLAVMFGCYADQDDSVR